MTTLSIPAEAVAGSGRREVHLVDLTSIPGMTYSATLGYLQAAAETDAEVSAACTFHRHALLPREPWFEQACERVLSALDDPFVVAFTIYFWNRAKSFELARRVKKRWPRCRIVVGGNDVSYQQDAVFAEAPWVDVLVHGDGELRFVELLRSFLHEVDIANVDGISYLTDSGRTRRLVSTPPAARIADLGAVPSPVGVHSDAELAQTTLVVYETNRGCPYSCNFCYWGGATNSKVRQFPLDRIEADLDRIIRLAMPGMTLGFGDANFGILPRDIEIARLLVELCGRHDKQLDFIMTWAKNSNKRVLEVAKVLRDGGLLSPVTLSTQSFDRSVLDLANRSNIRLENYRQLQTEFRSLGIPTYTDLIWGMPGETYDSFASGLEETLLSGGSPVIFPLLLLNNTEYTHERFAREHGVTVRESPCDVSDPEMVAKVVVSHAKMTEDEWLRGLELRLCVYLFQKALLRCTLRVLHAASGVRLVDLCELLRDFLFTACSEPTVRAIAQNYREAWQCPEKVDWVLIDSELGIEFGNNEVYIRSEMHYEAILHRVARDPEMAERFLTEAADFLLHAIPAESRPDRTLVHNVIGVDLAAVTVFQSMNTGAGGHTSFQIPAEVLATLRDAGDLPHHLVPTTGQRMRGMTTVPPDLLKNHHPPYSFSRYAMLVWRGLAAPLRDLSIDLAVADA
jgi:hypothetical protein